MTEAGRQRSGSASRHRRRPWLIVAMSMLIAVCCAPLALAASGGAGLTSSGGTKPKATSSSSRNPFATRGMWIWYVSQSNGGNVSSIIATAHRYGINTLLIKSGDGTGVWSQLSRGLVSTLHAHGLRVCGWQYVYGNSPVTEAEVGARAARNGADCLAIDAESEYEGKYVQAQSYIRKLRSLVGSRFPVALASFPYVDYHPGLPYSVFLGPGGAQYNVPQMYWHDIGVSVDTAYAHTFEFNRIYGRAIFPLGQLYGNPPGSQIKRFRQLSLVYGSTGVSWFDWQEASSGGWRAMTQQPLGSAGNVARGPEYASVSRGARGDVVVWAQEHLVSAGQKLSIDGSFGPGTQAAVKRFQAAHAQPATGTIGVATWQALLRYSPVKVTWTSSGARAASASTDVVPVPPSASLPARRDEIRPHGRG